MRAGCEGAKAGDVQLSSLADAPVKVAAAD